MPIAYVYTHCDPKTGELRYVGAGTRGRAWACLSHRSIAHAEWLEQLFSEGHTMADIVQIIAQNIGTEAAKEIERKEITRHRTERLFNGVYGVHSLTLNDTQISSARQLREDGKSYADVAEEIGTSTMTIYRALNNQTKGYENVIAN